MPAIDRCECSLRRLSGGEVLVPLRRACHCSARMRLLSFFLGFFGFCRHCGFLDVSGGFNASEFSSTYMFVTYMFVG